MKKFIIILLCLVFAVRVYGGSFFNKTPVANKQLDSLCSLVETHLDVGGDIDSAMCISRTMSKYAISFYDSLIVKEMLGKSMVAQRDCDSGFIYLNEARKYYLIEKQMDKVAEMYYYFAYGAINQNNLVLGKEYLTRALEYNSFTIENNDLLVNIYEQFFWVEICLVDNAKSAEYQRILDSLYANRTKDRAYYKIILDRVTGIVKSGKFESAESYLDSLLPKIEDDSYLYALWLYKKTWINELRGDYQTALELCQESYKLVDSTNNADIVGSNLMRYYLLNNEKKKGINTYFDIKSQPYSTDYSVMLEANYIYALIESDSMEKAKIIYSEVLEALKSGVDLHLLPGVIGLMYELNPHDSLFLYKELLDLYPDVISQASKNKKSDQSLASSLNNMILTADREIEAREAKIKMRTHYLVVVGILSIIILFAAFIIYRAYRKVKKINRTLKKSQELLSQEINSELRILIQKVIHMDNEYAPIRIGKGKISYNFRDMIKSIKELLRVVE